MMETNKILQGDCIELMRNLPDNSVDAIITDPPYGLAFMNKHWDKMDNEQFQRFSKKWANACWSALKPGGFLLAFGGTRTYHRMVCGIEDAGFEIRDTIMWLYGSGFPKSLNIGKQIDKIQGNEREVVGEESIGTYKSMSRIRVEQGYRENLTKCSNKIDVTKGNSEWEGWGTALKPACEPIVVARKPLSEKNVALNVLKWGTGGINVDMCRIPHNENLKETKRVGRENASVMSSENCGFDNTKSPKGRFPANIILDEQVGKMLDEQSGELFDFASPLPLSGKTNKKNTEYPNDKGGASRFFYCAKASKSERNNGCEEIEPKKQDLSRKEGNPRGDNPRNRGVHERTNHHPTVKPIKLMEYLIKLVSKENTVILDPFLGSGTTAIACLKLNRNFIGIEKEEEYIKIAKARIEPFLEQKKIKFAKTGDGEKDENN